MERQLTLETVRVTEAAALAAFSYLGRGEPGTIDQIASQAMEEALKNLPIQGHIIIGESAKKGTTRLRAGCQVGQVGEYEIDIALNPIEGTKSLARGGFNAISVMAFTQRNGILPLPDVYMKKLAVGPGLPADLVHLDADPIINLRELARAKRVAVSDLVVCILDRPRHQDLIAKVRAAGACIALIPDGDISGIIATAMPDTGIDMYLGSGGAFEATIASAALRSLGGTLLGQLIIEDEAQAALAKEVGITHFNRVYCQDDLVRGDAVFAATGVTSGTFLKGISRSHRGVQTHSILMRSQTGTLRRIEALHSITKMVHQHKRMVEDK